jgi:hypothetical protein
MWHLRVCEFDSRPAHFQKASSQKASTVERQELIEAVSHLPDEALLELASFLDYLRYKSAQQKQPNDSTASFLIAVAGLGNSGQEDTSERDEEILHPRLYARSARFFDYSPKPL